MKVGLIVSLLMWLSLALAFIGCGSSQGWRVSFGVSPVTAISDSQELSHEHKEPDAK